jgi:hypothetical protein
MIGIMWALRDLRRPVGTWRSGHSVAPLRLCSISSSTDDQSAPMSSSTSTRWNSKEWAGRCANSGPPRVSPASSTNDREETPVSLGAPPPPDQCDRPIRRRRRRHAGASRGAGSSRNTGPTSTSSLPDRRASRSPESSSASSGTQRAGRAGHVDRVGQLCGWVTGLTVVSLVILSIVGAPGEAYAAAGGIGTALAAALSFYLRRRL